MTLTTDQGSIIMETGCVELDGTEVKETTATPPPGLILKVTNDSADERVLLLKSEHSAALTNSRWFIVADDIDNGTKPYSTTCNVPDKCRKWINTNGDEIKSLKYKRHKKRKKEMSAYIEIDGTRYKVDAMVPTLIDGDGDTEYSIKKDRKNLLLLAQRDGWGWGCMLVSFKQEDEYWFDKYINNHKSDWTDACIPVQDKSKPEKKDRRGQHNELTADEMIQRLRSLGYKVEKEEPTPTSDEPKSDIDILTEYIRKIGGSCTDNGSGGVNIEIDYKHKDKVKLLGAIWSPRYYRWYITEQRVSKAADKIKTM